MSLAILIVALLVLDIAYAADVIQIPINLYRIINVATEPSVDDWLGGVLWSFVALEGFLLADLCAGSSRFPRVHIYAWRALALGFLFLGFDDSVGFHEALGQVATRSMGNLGTYSWHFLYGPPIVVALGVMGYVFVTTLTDKLARVLFALGVVANLAALACDLVEGLALRSQVKFATSFSPQNQFNRHWLKVGEELLEVVAIALILLALYRQIRMVILQRSRGNSDLGAA